MCDGSFLTVQNQFSYTEQLGVRIRYRSSLHEGAQCCVDKENWMQNPRRNCQGGAGFGGDEATGEQDSARAYQHGEGGDGNDEREDGSQAI